MENQEKMREYRRNYYHKNKETEKARIYARQQEIREKFQDYKSTLFCEHCGETHIACLDFHHKDPATKDIVLAHAVKQGWSYERIMDEVKKCVVLCSNCHRKVHYKNKAEIE
jgi:transcription elongation factor Elf1